MSDDARAELVAAPTDTTHGAPARPLSLSAALRVPGLQRFVASTLLWGSGHQLVTVSQSFLLFDLTGSTLYLAALGAAVGIPNVIVAVIGGFLADRIERKHLLIAGSLIAGTPMLIVAILKATDHLEPWHLLVAGSAQGISLAIDWTSRLSLLPSLVPRGTLVRAVSMDQTVFNAARVVGPLLGGAVLAAFGPATAYGIIAGLFGAAIVVYTTFKPRAGAQRESHAPLWADFGEVVRLLRENSILRINLMFTAINALVLGGFVFLIAAFASEVFDTDERGLGFIFGSIGFGAFLGAASLAARGGIAAAGRSLIITNLLAAAAVAGYAISETLYLALPLAFVFGYFNAVHIALGVSAIQLNVPDHVRGRVIGAYEVAWSSFPLGGLVLGALATGLSLKTAVLIGAAAMAAFTVATWTFSESFRNLRMR